MNIVRNKAYRLRRVGVRGSVIQIPQAYLDRHSLDVGDEAWMFENDKGELILKFKNGMTYDEAKAIAGKRKR